MGQSRVALAASVGTRESHVEHLDRAASGSESEVCRFQIAMDEPAIVDVLQAERGLPGILAGPADIESAVGHDLAAKVGTGHVLHRQVKRVVGDPGVVGVNDVLVIESADESHFA